MIIKIEVEDNPTLEAVQKATEAAWLFMGNGNPRAIVSLEGDTYWCRITKSGTYFASWCKPE
jgi:hypothetical protein